MATYRISDQTQHAIFYESGTYGTLSGGAAWIGMVQSNEIDEGMGVINVRYAGANTRNVAQFVDGPTEFTGTIEFYPQDFRFLKFVLGQCADAGSPSPYTHTYSESDSSESCPEIANQVLPSFTVEDAQRITGGSNVIRRLVGCMVDSFTMAVGEGAPVTCTTNYRGQNVTFISGTAANVTVGTSGTVPFMWQHVRVDIPSGTQINTVKDCSFTINNNLQAPHYVDATRNISAPIPTNRDYEVTLTLNADSRFTKTFYDSYFQGGSTFNMLMTGIISAGSRQVDLAFSGCKMTDMSMPSPAEGIVQETLTITPQQVDAIESNLMQWFNIGSYA